MYLNRHIEGKKCICLYFGPIKRLKVSCSKPERLLIMISIGFRKTCLLEAFGNFANFIIQSLSQEVAVSVHHLF